MVNALKMIQLTYTAIQSSVELWISAARISVNMVERTVGLNPVTEADNRGSTCSGIKPELKPAMEGRNKWERVGDSSVLWFLTFGSFMLLVLVSKLQ